VRTDGLPTSGSAQVDLSWALRKANRGRLFAALGRIYASLPEMECDGCARCCFESPGVFFIEHLRLMVHLSLLPPEQQESLLRRALGELLFSWIDRGRTCIFLHSSACTIYQFRPLACRLFGLVSPGDREQAEPQARMAAREEARRLSLLGIAVPEEIVTRSLLSCSQVRSPDGRAIRSDGDALAAQVALLDGALLPRQVVVQEFCFRSLPERLGAAWLGDGAVELLRLQLLRRAQHGESIEDLLAQVWALAASPRQQWRIRLKA